MSIFKDKAIILKISKKNIKDVIITIFSYNFGKIQVTKKFNKKEKNLDLGYIVNCEIITKEKLNISKITNIKIISEFNTNENKNFKIIENYLKILSKIYIELPKGVENKEIFKIIEFINSQKKIDNAKLILSNLKIKAILGNLDIHNKDEKIQKILKFVYFSRINEIFKLTGITKDLERNLEKKQ